jgi:energy-coupling factor transport system ATP-binding protein
MGEGCVCIVGQNGAGKTTFVKHLNGLLEPTSGRVDVEGVETSSADVAQLSRHVGLSFQNPDDQLFHGTVEEEVRYGPSNLDYEAERVDELVEWAIDLLGLDPVREKNPYDLGIPRRKRVAVASVIAMDTPVVVLDEPTGGQDAPGTRRLGKVVDRLVEEGKLVVVITHDVSFAADHADRVIALRQGEVLLDDSPRAVFGRPDVLARTEVQLPTAAELSFSLDLPRVALSVNELLEML